MATLYEHVLELAAFHTQILYNLCHHVVKICYLHAPDSHHSDVEHFEMKYSVQLSKFDM
jgi:hypothetical protein